MKAKYDVKIKNHYDSVATRFGDNSASTMEDEFVRTSETKIILDVVSAYLDMCSKNQAVHQPVKLLDIGCGNGFTLEALSTSGLEINCHGIEPNEKLREIANARLEEAGIKVRQGDLRDQHGAIESTFDIVVSQRVLINILDPIDQAVALQSLVQLLEKGGILISFESFSSGLKRLNLARTEFGLKEIQMADHNLYLCDDYFDVDSLEPWPYADSVVRPNYFSSHYYISRVLHEAMLTMTDSEFVRNSHFVKFMSAAIPIGVGDYAPLQINLLHKI
jgi:2-polyprenyl-3-methyl-5-hydroxy-6-metoxy-1,4-benzoquinol methylase